MKRCIAIIVAGLVSSTAFASEDWIALFNGKDLNGWVVKIKGAELGENPDRIFRVEDGVLTVSYEDMKGPFRGRFGHIFINRPFTNYHFRCEYRFIGEQVEGGPEWAVANSGAMLHCRDPGTMPVNKAFPDCIEFQFLGQNASGKRPTGNVCTPGSYVDFNGETVVKHIIQGTGIALPLGDWVKAEAIVKDGKLQHLINGKVVIEYSNPKDDDGTPLTHGWIALQAESHPCQFRNIEICELD